MLKQILGPATLVALLAATAGCATKAADSQTVAEKRKPASQDAIRDPFDALQNPAVGFSPRGARSPYSS